MRPQETVHVFGPPGIQQLVQTALGFPGIHLAMPVVLAEFSTRPGDKQPPEPAANLANVMLARLCPDTAEEPQAPSPQVPTQQFYSCISFHHSAQGAFVLQYGISAGSHLFDYQVGINLYVHYRLHHRSVYRVLHLCSPVWLECSDPFCPSVVPSTNC
jgi:hypothetical protein